MFLWRCLPCQLPSYLCDWIPRVGRVRPYVVPVHYAYWGFEREDTGVTRRAGALGINTTRPSGSTVQNNLRDRSDEICAMLFTANTQAINASESGLRQSEYVILTLVYRPDS